MKKLLTTLFILAIALSIKAQTTLSGTISDSTSAVSYARVKLFRATGIFVDSVEAPGGTYTFNNILPGNYIIVAKGDTAVYKNHIRTYYGQSVRWRNATAVTVTDTTPKTGLDILLIQIPNWAGTNNTGYCSGTIVRGTGQRAGDPIPGIDIALEQIPGGIIKANTQTNDSGFFEVKKIPNGMKYSLLVEIPGLDMDSTYTVEVVNGDSALCLDFVVDTTMSGMGIYTTNLALTSVFSFHKNEYDKITVYPNPSSSIFFIELPEENATIRVTALDGKLIEQTTIYSNKARLDLSDQPKGVYLVEVSTKENIQVIKAIKE